jgi:FkbM family methyltransferase
MIYSEVAKLWIPDDSVKTDRCWRFIERNAADLNKGIAHVKKRGTALQAGGHIGIFPNHLASRFKQVYTFEPDPLLYACLRRNVVENVQGCNAALSSLIGRARFRSNVGGTGAIDEAGDDWVDVVPFDSLEVDVNFIHLDVEGHEVEALLGCQRVIERCSPVLQLEVLPRYRDALYAYVESIGYQLATDKCRDHVFVRL